MEIPFWKYEGAGNDFIMIDQRSTHYIKRGERARIAWMCDRHFGIGADGLILLQNHASFDFEMVYFNSDGNESSMCGNGGRCIVAFAYDRELKQDSYRFIAIDGPHEASIQPKEPGNYWVELKMQDIDQVLPRGADYELNTGSPHFIRFAQQLEQSDMVAVGRSVRYAPPYEQDGINVNLVEPMDSGIRVRTYERGVEDETLACGTGVTAAALAFSQKNADPDGTYETPIQAEGGQLAVRFSKTAGAYHNIWLCGPAKFVFEGKINI
jgi:diaminopimelate epimerase